jgi:hypothetical protein
MIFDTLFSVPREFESRPHCRMRAQDTEGRQNICPLQGAFNCYESEFDTSYKIGHLELCGWEGTCLSKGGYSLKLEPSPLLVFFPSTLCLKSLNIKALICKMRAQVLHPKHNHHWF